MGTHFYEQVESVAEICLGKLMNDRLNQSTRNQSAKLMRFCIGACADFPDRQRALFIMSYIKLMQELETFVAQEKYGQINTVLKEVHKHLRTLEPLKDKGVTIFNAEDSKTLIDRLK